MASGCVAPNLDTTRYSSPVSIIGLYIAAGSSVCFLLMLFDIISAYRRRESWIPCRFFKLNSFTLTMLSVASKLQVDLTTTMPGVPDQLSKLTGTALLCICMGFFNLCVGNNGDSEYLSDMVSLSIMVITVVVNICIQLSTGVIYLFIPEHIIMMSCMMIVLLLMWCCGRETKVRNQLDIEDVTSNMTSWSDGITVLLVRLKVSYAVSFDKNRQMRACRFMGNLILVPFCIVCLGVLVQAIVRSLLHKQLRLCGGASDYDWSTWFILVTQILTIFLGCFAVCFRWFASFSFLLIESGLGRYVEDDESMKKKFIATLGFPSCYKLGIYFQTSLYYLLIFLSYSILTLPVLMFRVFGGKFHDLEEENLSPSTEEFIKEKIYGPCASSIFSQPCIRTRIMEKVINDLDKCVEESSRGTPKELLKLISRIHPSSKSRNFALPYKLASPLPLAALVKTAITCLPDEASTKTLVLCFHEAIDILRSIVDPKDPGYELFMKDPLLVDKQFDDILRRARNKFLDNKSLYGHKRVKDFLMTIIYGHRYVNIIEEISEKKHETLEDLCCMIEQLFVDVLHSSFAELPNAVFKLATECPMDEYKERVRPVLVALLKIAPLEDYVKWSFPEHSGISNLTLPPSLRDVATNDRNNQTEEESPREDDVAVVGMSSNFTRQHVTLEIEEV